MAYEGFCWLSGQKEGSVEHSHTMVEVTEAEFRWASFWDLSFIGMVPCYPWRRIGTLRRSY